MESILDLYLEVKNTFSKLHPLPGVRNCVVKATLCQPKHLKHTEAKLPHATFPFYTLLSWVEHVQFVLNTLNRNVLWFTWAAIPILPSFNIPMAYLYPWPICPKMFFSGTYNGQQKVSESHRVHLFHIDPVFGCTLTLSKLSGQVEDARRPSLFSFLQISSPSVSRSTMKQVMPLYPCKSKVCLFLHLLFWITYLFYSTAELHISKQRKSDVTLYCTPSMKMMSFGIFTLQFSERNTINK